MQYQFRFADESEMEGLCQTVFSEEQNKLYRTLPNLCKVAIASNEDGSFAGAQFIALGFHSFDLFWGEASIATCAVEPSPPYTLPDWYDPLIRWILQQGFVQPGHTAGGYADPDSAFVNWLLGEYWGLNRFDQPPVVVYYLSYEEHFAKGLM